MTEKRKKRPVNTNFKSGYFYQVEETWVMVNHLTQTVGIVRYNENTKTYYFIPRMKKVYLDFPYVRDLANFMGLLEKRKDYEH